MKPRVTSQEKILEQAMEIAKREGVDKLSVRKLSSACGIAIGSVYNYFPNKDALVTAMADAFWSGIFKDQKKLYRSGMGFTSFLEQYYSFLYVKMAPYDGSWVEEMDGKIPKKEAIRLLRQALLEDTRVNASIWNMEFHPESFCEYVFTNLMALLQSGEGNPRFFIFLLENLLYKN
jgi:AcrR family transcriptional regulator